MYSMENHTFVSNLVPLYREDDVAGIWSWSVGHIVARRFKINIEGNGSVCSRLRRLRGYRVTGWQRFDSVENSAKP